MAGGKTQSRRVAVECLCDDEDEDDKKGEDGEKELVSSSRPLPFRRGWTKN